MRMRSVIIVGGAALVALAVAGCAQANSVPAGSTPFSATSNSSSDVPPPTASPIAASASAVATGFDSAEVHSKVDARVRTDADLAAVRLPAGAV